MNQAFKGLPQNYNVELLEKFRAVTKDEVLHALKTRFLPLFHPSSSIAVVVTAPSKASEISEGLTAIGFDVSQMTLEADADEDGESDNGSESDSDESSSDGRSN